MSRERHRRGVKGVKLVCLRAPRPATFWLSGMVGASVSGPSGEHLGHLRDLAVRRTRSGTVVDAILVDAGGYCFALPADTVTCWQRRRLRVSALRRTAGTTHLTEAPRDLLAETVLGKPMPVLTSAAHTRATRVSDVGLRRLRDGRWIVSLVDTRPAWQRRCGLPRRTAPWIVLTRRCIVRRPGRDHRLGPAPRPASAARAGRRAATPPSSHAVPRRLGPDEPSSGAGGGDASTTGRCHPVVDHVATRFASRAAPGVARGGVTLAIPPSRA